MDNSTTSKEKNRLTRMEHWKLVSIYLMVYDAFAVTFSYFLALLLRFDFKYSAIPVVYLKPWELFAPIYAIVCILIFWRLRLYRSIWRFASFKELQRITLATIVTAILHIAGVTAIQRAYLSGTDYAVDRMPLSYYIMGAIFQMILVAGIRFSYRFVLLLRASRSGKAASNIMIVGTHSIIGAT